KSVKISQLISTHGATLFREALSKFVVHHSDPTLSLHQVNAKSHLVHFPFNAVPIFHRIKFSTPDPFTAGGPTSTIIDAVHVQPPRKLAGGEAIPGRFDTVLVNDGTGELTGVKG
ncbi:hypothetical protein B0H16DRAFT_1212182, partial [Mycena metata]